MATPMRPTTHASILGSVSLLFNLWPHLAGYQGPWPFSNKHQINKENSLIDPEPLGPLATKLSMIGTTFK